MKELPIRASRLGSSYKYTSSGIYMITPKNADKCKINSKMMGILRKNLVK